MRDGLVASLVVERTVRGDNWTVAIFKSSCGDNTWSGHVLFAGDGETNLGFKTERAAAEWAVETLRGYLDE